MRVMHIMRSPVGGLFRHVVDLAGEQAKMGFDVGIIADSSTGGARADAVLSDLAPALSLGVERIPMSRHIGWSDFTAWRSIKARLAAKNIDIVHGHGAKGGAYARLSAPKGSISVYTPHGGSLHYNRTSPVGLAYLTLEQILARKTKLFLFESDYSRRKFIELVCDPGIRAHVVHNGVSDAEFEPVSTAADATDVLFIGELRALKGVDILIDALKILHTQGHRLSATIVGAGPDVERFKKQAEPLKDYIRFAGAMPTRQAFTRGSVLCVPSRHESLPYIILEGAAAGLPVIATNVGGISEIFGPLSDRLVPPDHSPALATMLLKAQSPCHDTALQERVKSYFSLTTMAEGVGAAYAKACHL